MKKVLSIDATLCTGCRVCEVVCSLSKSKEGVVNPVKARVKVFKVDTEGIDIPVMCQQCEDALCMDVCPVNALQRDSKTGAIVVREETCVGCRACTLVCPYGAITVDVDTRVSSKCDLCGGDPQCARFCITKAIRYERSDVADTQRQEARMESIARAFLRSREVAS